MSFLIHLRFFFPVIFILVLNGCTGTLNKRFIRESHRPQEVTTFFKQLDQAVVKAGVEHHAYARIEGFPYLRTNRYLLSLKDHLDSQDRKKDWLSALQKLDLEAREKEILTLPITAIERLSEHFDLTNTDSRQGLIQKTREFSNTLLTHEIQKDDLYEVLTQSMEVPDDYSICMRTFGLYPLVMPVVAYFTDNAYDKMRDRNKIPPDKQKVHGKMIAYSPPSNTIDKETITRSIYNESNRDPFGLPKLSESDELTLARIYAPVFHHDVADTFDRLGAMEWESGKLKTNIHKPTVYYYFTAALLQGKPIIQINYVTWTAGRLGPNAPSIEHGELDGITLRISLDDSGKPFMVDGMNNCGCYHFFIPDKERFLKIIPTSWEFDPVVIDFFPSDFPAKPIGLKVTSGWHQIEDVGTDLAFAEREIYQLVPYHHLEAIPRKQNEYASMFDNEGVAIGSDRIEIYIFFSMGIPRVGAMRQRGHHPTKLVGRAHFDDPYLLDHNFKIK